MKNWSSDQFKKTVLWAGSTHKKTRELPPFFLSYREKETLSRSTRRFAPVRPSESNMPKAYIVREVEYHTRRVYPI